MLTIVADANIPLVTDALREVGDVRTVPGREITSATLADADVLLVRSVTAVGDELLEGSRVRFVGTATAGTDHVDQAALARRGITFASAPGSNAASVADWVVAALLATAADRDEDIEGRTLGVVGVGAVGGRVIPRAQALGFDVVACDPPRADAGADGLVALDEILDIADVVTLHTPLTADGRWPTVGMIDADAVGRMKPGAWLVNAARGAVVTAGAARALAVSRPTLLDVWPDEPSPDPALVADAVLGTPHIAGYAWDGKVRGTRMVADAVRSWLADGETPRERWQPRLAAAPRVEAPREMTSDAAWLDALTRKAYDVRADDARFRAAMAGSVANRAAAFSDLRKTYPRRRELSMVRVVGDVPAHLRHAVADGLGMRLEG